MSASAEPEDLRYQYAPRVLFTAPQGAEGSQPIGIWLGIYAFDSREAILQAADVFLYNGVLIKTGPQKDAVQQTLFLYVFEPGGNRVEVAMPVPG